jgi:hypothetical protein
MGFVAVVARGRAAVRKGGPPAAAHAGEPVRANAVDTRGPSVSEAICAGGIWYGRIAQRGWPPEGKMAGIDRAYVAIALVLLLVGELVGFYMGLASDMKLRSLHITIVLLGFVTLSLFGVAFRLWPAMKTGALAAAQFWLSVVAVIGIVIGTYQYSTTGGIAIVAPASALMIVATALLLWLFWTRSEAM